MRTSLARHHHAHLKCSNTCSADSAGARSTARQASPINPFAGTIFYVNPDYAKNAATSLARVAANSTDAAKIRAVQVRAHLLELQHSAAWQGRPAFIIDEWPATCRGLRQLYMLPARQRHQCTAACWPPHVGDIL